jgi:hypothetical protein
LAQKKPGPIGRRKDGEGACLEYRDKLWRARLQVKACGRQICKEETVWCQSEEEEPWDGSDLTVVFQEAVSYL